MKVIVLSIGHTGSRIIGQILKASGFDTGNVNKSFDTVNWSGADQRKAVQMAQTAAYTGTRWSWAPPARPAGYLDDAPEAWKHGWPSLCMPWLLDRYPDARYIRWIRDPRDTVLWDDHGVNLFRKRKIAGFAGLDYRDAAGEFIRYWWHQQMVYKPKYCLQVRYEDYCDDPESIIYLLELYLGRKMTAVPSRPNSVGRWQRENEPPADSVERAAREMYYADVPHRLHSNL